MQLPTDPGSHIIDQTLYTERLDELEHALNLIAPQRIVNASAGNHADGKVAYQGRSELGIFRARVGRNVDLFLEPEEADDRLAFVIASSGAGELLFNGKTFSHASDRAVIMTSGSKRLLKFSEETETKALLVSRVSMAECCAKLLGHDIPGFVDFDVSANLESDAGRSWLRLLSYAEAELTDPHSLIRHSPAAWRQFEHRLLTGFLLCQRHEYSQALLAPQAAAVPLYVRRAEAYIEAHFAEPLSLADIAAQAGVSARSLQDGFQSFRHMTPIMFLHSVRLRRAHEALRAADPALTTVMQVALACGFTHMGEFDTAYRSVFGVTPSWTLNKKR
ncbi:helix-turn-helix domain-containing protein [Microvirga sp. 2MCAF35]|uniref:helix-turn-helix domain-containing protein n=1 Tax=Microvirga sp. 2MCAF35 TaxID=3232987 RepID=UPI003F9DDACD